MCPRRAACVREEHVSAKSWVSETNRGLCTQPVSDLHEFVARQRDAGVGDRGGQLGE